MRLITILLGFVLLVGGNQLYWMFVGAVGFFLGTRIAELIGFNQSEWQVLTFALATGLACTFLSYYLKRIMVVLAGFVAGGYVMTSLPAILGWNNVLSGWLAFVIAGALSALILILSYRLSLIVISALAGAILIVQNLTFSNISDQVMFLVLIIFGIVSQWVLMQYTFRPKDDV